MALNSNSNSDASLYAPGGPTLPPPRQRLFGNAPINIPNTNTNTNTNTDDEDEFLYAPEYNASNVFNVEAVDNEMCVDYINSLRDIRDELADKNEELKDKGKHTKQHAYENAIENVDTTINLIEEQLTSRNGPNHATCKTAYEAIVKLFDIRDGKFYGILRRGGKRTRKMKSKNRSTRKIKRNTRKHKQR